jgi:branched-chain amino acid aminotransferase
MLPENYVQANLSGTLHDARQPGIAPLNRGFLYGDAVYEVWRTYHGVVFAWEEHWQRLEASAQALHLPLPLQRDELRAEILRTVQAFSDCTGWRGEVYIRLQVTRGAGPIGLDPALADESDFVLLVQINREYPAEKTRAGLRLSLARDLARNDRRTLNPAWKTGNYLNNLLCLREARQRGADEVIMLNLAGELTEAAVSNVHFVRGAEILTPPLDSGLLAGVTRRLLIEKIAPVAGLGVREVALRPDDLKDLQECFLTSTTKDLTPVAAIDEFHFAVGDNSVTSRLKAVFADYARSYAHAHPELRVI